MCLNIFAQGIIDERLVISTTGSMHATFEMLDNIGIKPNGYPDFIWIRLNDRTTLSFRKIFSHSNRDLESIV